MIASIYILIGFAIGCGGFLLMGSNPDLGGGALLLSGFLVLAGVDRLGHSPSVQSE